MSPGARSPTLVPTSRTSPTNSWPTMSGGWMVFCAHGSQSAMCRSVPQMPVLCTRIRTSLIDISGSGTSRSSRPGPAVDLTSACITRAYSDGPVAGGAVGGSGARSPLVRVRPGADPVRDRADALDLAADAITRFQEDRRVAEDTDTLRGAGRDEVTRLQRDRRGDERDEGRHIPDHV